MMPTLPDPLSRNAYNKDEVCIIVRTSRMEGLAATYSLLDLLVSLKNLHHKQWRAHVFIADDEDFVELPEILRRVNDSRIRYLDSPIRNPWDPEHAAYEATDWAIEQCSADAKWLLVTNGDNWYHPAFLDFLDPEYDIVGTDFFSRHVRLQDGIGTDDSGLPSPNPIALAGESRAGLDAFDDPWEPCAKHALKSCMSNVFSRQHTDLGAQVSFSCSVSWC
jgi:hypothetical protein